VNDYVWQLIVRCQPLLLIKDLHKITESVCVEIGTLNRFRERKQKLEMNNLRH